MPSKILLLVVLGFANLAAAARAELGVSLLEIAPYCRSLVKARFMEKTNGVLKFEVKRIYVGDETSELQVPAYHWRQAWGEAREGFEGFFVYSHNPQVDAVFPIEEDEVLIDPAGAASAG